MLKGGATHIGVATDHVIESFRNDLWPGYKTGEDIEPDLLAQFPLFEEVLPAAGIIVWPMVEFEAGDRALLFRTLATLRTDIKLFDDVDELRWNGPTPAFAPLAARLDAAITDARRPVLRSAARR